MTETRTADPATGASPRDARRAGRRLPCRRRPAPPACPARRRDRLSALAARGSRGRRRDGGGGRPRERRQRAGGRKRESPLARLAGEYEEDDWGFDPGYTDNVKPFFDFMYDGWWRVDAIGVDRVPATGRALLVANHAGVLPWDATMMASALLRHHPHPRHPRFLVLNWAFQLPWVASFMRKVGGVPASPHNAERLLREDNLVAVFPEGVKGAGKDFSERYRLQRFGRGGFVEVALRTGAPIVPVAVVGSEETYPKIGEARLLARLTGAPYFPVTPTFPALGPLGVVPLPSKWRIEFCEPISLAQLRPGGGRRPHARARAHRARPRHDPAERSRTWSNGLRLLSDRLHGVCASE